MTLPLEINWFAALLGGVLAYALGSVWFSPKVFGAAWMAAQPHRQPEDYAGCAPALIAEAVSTLLLAAITSYLLAVGGLAAAALLAVVIVLIYFSNARFLDQPSALWTLVAGYKLVSMGLIVAVHWLL